MSAYGASRRSHGSRRRSRLAACVAFRLGTARESRPSRSGFQTLDRIQDERGTLRAYNKLAATDVDVPAYGTPDHDPATLTDELTLHAHPDGEIPDSWFVVHDGDGDDDRKAALVAVETAPGEYRGFWTFEPARVDGVLDYIEETYVGSTT